MGQIGSKLKPGMKNVIIMLMLFLLIIPCINCTFCTNCTGCTGEEEKTAYINTGKCVEIAMQYMRNKYQKDFRIESVYTRLEYGKHQVYVQVGVKSEEDQEVPDYVLVYPDDYSDQDGDGYMDCYHVVSDNYMSKMVKPFIKKEIEQDLKSMGINQFNVTSAYVKQILEIDDFKGLEADFPIPKEENISIEKLVSEYEKVDFTVRIVLPEGKDSENIQQKIIDFYSPKLRGASMYCYVDIFTQNVYDKRFAEKEIDNFAYRGNIESLDFNVVRKEVK